MDGLHRLYPHGRSQQQQLGTDRSSQQFIHEIMNLFKIRLLGKSGIHRKFVLWNWE